MKKILVVSSYPAPYRVAVFRGLAQHYQLDVFFEFNRDQNRNSDWFVKSRDFSVLDTEEAKAGFRDCLKNISSYDLLLAYDYNNKNARTAMRKCIRKHVPYCVNCDGAFINKHWLKDIVKRYYVSHAAACFASGRFAHAYFSYYGAEDKNIYEHSFTSLTAEDIDALTEDMTMKMKLRMELGFTMPKVVLTIGQFIYRKGFDVLLNAWKDLDGEAQLVVIGGGDLESQYMDFIRENRLQNVSILGFMKKEELYKYYRAVDLFVLPTREDIWGLVINEAMGCGLPVVSTDQCIAAMELVENGVNGFVVPSEDAGRMAEAIRFVLSDDELRQKMRVHNINKMKNCTLEQIVEKHLEVIEKIV